MTVAVVVGSAFRDGTLGGRTLTPTVVDTPFGAAEVHRWPGRDAWVVARHGMPHRYLPHQVPFRANAWALRALGVGALLLTSSVGVLVDDLPLFTPLLLGDLWMPENRLPGGGPCTLWPEPAADQAHLVVEEGLFNRALTDRIAAWLPADTPRDVVFAYQPGPRTKTPAENRFLRGVGAQVNSMSIGPEVVLANEAGIPVAGAVIGHKRSGADPLDRLADGWVAASLAEARAATERLVVRFLDEAVPVPFANRLFRFGQPS